MHQEKIPKQVSCGKRNPDNGPEERQRPGRTALCKRIDRLFTRSSLGRARRPFLSGCAPLPRFCLNSFSLCSPTCCAISLMINFIPAFTVAASVTNAFSLRAKIPGKIASSFQPLLVQWPVLVLIQAFRFNCWEGVKISLHVIAPSLRSRTAISKKSPTNKSYSGEGNFPTLLLKM